MTLEILIWIPPVIGLAMAIIAVICNHLPKASDVPEQKKES